MTDLPSALPSATRQAPMSLTHDDVLAILEMLGNEDLEYFGFRAGDTVIVASRGGGVPTPVVTASVPAAVPVVVPVVVPPPVAAPDGAGRAEPDGASEPSLADVPAPMLGTFFRSPEPGAPPFVEVGTTVRAGDTVGLVEVMKTFNGVTAGVSGTVAEVLADNGTFVEYNQPLLRIRPTGGA